MGYGRLMPIVTQCTAPGCETLTMGPLCVEHDQRTPTALVRTRMVPELTNETPRTLVARDPAVVGFRRASERRAAARSLR